MNQKKTLNDILENYQRIENELINNDGVINEELENSLNIHQAELGQKLDGYEHFVRYLKTSSPWKLYCGPTSRFEFCFR